MLRTVVLLRLCERGRHPSTSFAVVFLQLSNVTAQRSLRVAFLLEAVVDRVVLVRTHLFSDELGFFCSSRRHEFRVELRSSIES